MQPREVIFAPEARDHLLKLYGDIADAAGAAVAMGYIERLERYCLNFSHASMRGTARDDVREGLRIVGFEKRVTIAFSVDETTVTILGLFYGGRDWENLMA